MSVTPVLKTKVRRYDETFSRELLLVAHRRTLYAKGQKCVKESRHVLSFFS